MHASDETATFVTLIVGFPGYEYLPSSVYLPGFSLHMFLPNLNGVLLENQSGFLVNGWILPGHSCVPTGEFDAKHLQIRFATEGSAYSATLCEERGNRASEFHIRIHRNCPG